MRHLLCILYMTMMTVALSSSALSFLPRHLPGAYEFIGGSGNRGPCASSIHGQSWSLAGLVGAALRLWVVVVIVRQIYGRLSSFLGGWDHLWWWDLCHIPWGRCGGGAEVGWLWVVGPLWATLVGMWWLLVEDAMSQVCDIGIINVPLACEINNMMWYSVLPCFKPFAIANSSSKPIQSLACFGWGH